MKDMFFLWHQGHVGEKIRPFSKLRPIDMGGVTQKRELSRLRGVMGEVNKIAATNLDDWCTISDLPHDELGLIFDNAFRIFISQLYGDKVWREGDKVLGTLYNKLCRHRSGGKKRKRSED